MLRVSFILCALLVCGGCGPAERTESLDPAEALQIDRWYGGAEAALSLTVDDGLPAPFDLLMPEIERRGWYATFFICTKMADEAGSWPKIVRAYEHGHEIGNHSHTHRDLTRLSEVEIVEELERSILALQTNLGWDAPLESFAFPYEASTPAIGRLVWDYHRYLRGGDGGVPVPPNPLPLNDPYDPDFTFLQAKAPTQNYELPQWNAWIDIALNRGAWLIEEYHGVEGQDWAPRTLEEYRAHFDHVEAFGERVWVAPLADVGHYVDERRTAQFEVLRWTSQEIVLRLTDGFGPQHDTPLSFTVRIPAEWGWRRLRAFQDRKAMPAVEIEPGLWRTEALPEPELEIRLTDR